MLTLYGTEGSRSAAAEAGLDIAGVAYRTVDAASRKPSPRLDELGRIDPIVQIPKTQQRVSRRAAPGAARRG